MDTTEDSPEVAKAAARIRDTELGPPPPLVSEENPARPKVAPHVVWWTETPEFRALVEIGMKHGLDTTHLLDLARLDEGIGKMSRGWFELNCCIRERIPQLRLSTYYGSHEHSTSAALSDCVAIEVTSFLFWKKIMGEATVFPFQKFLAPSWEPVAYEHFEHSIIGACMPLVSPALLSHGPPVLDVFQVPITRFWNFRGCYTFDPMDFAAPKEDNWLSPWAWEPSVLIRRKLFERAIKGASSHWTSPSALTQRIGSIETGDYPSDAIDSYTEAGIPESVYSLVSGSVTHLPVPVTYHSPLSLVPTKTSSIKKFLEGDAGTMPPPWLSEDSLCVSRSWVFKQARHSPVTFQMVDQMDLIKTERCAFLRTLLSQQEAVNKIDPYSTAPSPGVRFYWFVQMFCTYLLPGPVYDLELGIEDKSTKVMVWIDGLILGSTSRKRRAESSFYKITEDATKDVDQLVRDNPVCPLFSDLHLVDVYAVGMARADVEQRVLQWLTRKIGSEVEADTDRFTRAMCNPNFVPADMVNIELCSTQTGWLAPAMCYPSATHLDRPDPSLQIIRYIVVASLVPVPVSFDMYLGHCSFPTMDLVMQQVKADRASVLRASSAARPTLVKEEDVADENL